MLVNTIGGNSLESMLRLEVNDVIDDDQKELMMKRLMVCLPEAIPAGITGFVVILLGGPVVVAVLLSGGVAFASYAAVRAMTQRIQAISTTYGSTDQKVMAVDAARKIDPGLPPQ
jgi:arginine exporter protein ArgO